MVPLPPPQKGLVTFKPLGPCEHDLIWEKGLCGCIELRVLEIRSSWVTEIGPQASDKCP